MELKITIENIDTKTISAIWREEGENDEEKDGKLVFDPLILRTIKIFRDWLGQGKMEREEIEVMGSLLYNMLFGDKDGEIGGFFEEKLKDANDNKKLQLKLQFDKKANQLIGLPWEYLFMPGTGFLSTRVNLVLSRWIPPNDGVEEEETRDKQLRVLLVVSEPKIDLDGRDMNPIAWSDIVVKMQEVSKNHNIDLTELKEPTLESVQKKIKGDKPPHVLHFIGHGRVKKTEHDRGQIALLEEDLRTVYWCPDSEFAEDLGKAGVRVVFLHLCQQPDVNKQNFHASFVGLAPQLIQANVPAVVATQFPIPNSDAQTFIREFYKGLAKGESVDSAVQAGRRRIRNSSRFGTPVLFMIKQDGVIKPYTDEESDTGKSLSSSTSRPDDHSTDEVVIDNLPKKTFDVATVGLVKADEESLSDEQREPLGLVFNELFSRPDLTPNEMKGILHAASSKADPEVKPVIMAMIQEVDKIQIFNLVSLGKAREDTLNLDEAQKDALKNLYNQLLSNPDMNPDVLQATLSNVFVLVGPEARPVIEVMMEELYNMRAVENQI